jgi:hypothetical protein
MLIVMLCFSAIACFILCFAVSVKQALYFAESNLYRFWSDLAKLAFPVVRPTVPER